MAGIEVQKYVNATISQVINGTGGEPDGATALRDVTASALASIYVGPNSFPLILELLETVFAKEDEDGTFPWSYNMNYSQDGNGVQFAMLPVARLLNEFPSMFPAEWLSTHMPNITKAVTAIYNETFFEASPFYTNIYTMRLVNLYLFSQITQNQTHIDWANEALSLWTSMIRTAGIHEFSSPVYTGVAFGNLFAGLGSMTNQTAVSMLQKLTNFMAADAAASYFPPNIGMAGPHSRDYDFVFGDGGISWYYSFSGIAKYCNYTFGGGDWYLLDADGITDAHLYVEMVRNEITIASTNISNLACFLSRRQEASSSASSPPPWRMVRAAYSQREGPISPLNGTDRYTMITSSFSLGVACSAYGPQDKLLSSWLGRSGGGFQPIPNGPSLLGGPRIPQSNWVIDKFDSPYGRVDIPDASGHSKPSHLYATISAVQDGALGVALFDLSPEFRGDMHSNTTVFSSIGANILLPLGPLIDAIYVNNSKLECYQSGCNKAQIPVGSAIAIQSDGGMLFFRFFLVDALVPATSPVTSWIQFDGPNGTYSGRYTSYLYNGPNTTFKTLPVSSRVGVLFGGAVNVTDEETALIYLQAFQDIEIETSFFTSSSSMSRSGSDGGDGMWNVTTTNTWAEGLAKRRRERKETSSGSSSSSSSSSPLILLPGYESTFSVGLNITSSAIRWRCINGTNPATDSMEMPTPGALTIDWFDGTTDFITLDSWETRHTGTKERRLLK